MPIPQHHGGFPEQNVFDERPIKVYHIELELNPNHYRNRKCLALITIFSVITKVSISMVNALPSL